MDGITLKLKSYDIDGNEEEEEDENIDIILLAGVVTTEEKADDEDEDEEIISFFPTDFNRDGVDMADVADEKAEAALLENDVMPVDDSLS